jgi:integrase
MKKIKINKTTTVIHTKYNETQTIPTIVIIDDNNPRISNLAYYFLKLLLDKKTPVETLRHKAKSICSLYDYYLLINKPTKPAETRLFLDSYAKARMNGTVLNWDKYSQPYINKNLYDIEEFSRWVAKHSEVAKDTPDSEFAQVIKESYQFLNRSQNSLLFHTRHQNHRRPMNRGLSVGTLKVVKSFPVDKVMDLINEAHSPRDKIAYILMAFGGRRISECLHMFVSDFAIVNSQLRVLIAHPENSLYQWKLENVIKRGTREEYLKEMFNRVPRNKLGKTNESVGWRGIKFEKPEVGMSEVYFVGAIEDYLLRLHLEYMTFRKQFPDNPYYFVTRSGRPLCYRSLLNRFMETCEKLGLKIESNLNQGIHTYGLRHFYGYYCSQVLKLEPLIIQKLIGHTSPLFSMKYQQDKEQVFQELEKINSGVKLIGRSYEK